MSKECCTIDDNRMPEDHGTSIITNGRELHAHDHDNHDDHAHDHGDPSSLITYIPAILSFVMLAFGIIADHYGKPEFFQNETLRIIWYSIAYIIVGHTVVREAWETISKGQFFTEFSLMTIATLGAFSIGNFPEGVSVMLFYYVGELFQSAAVNRSKANIKALLDVRPNIATVFRNNEWQDVDPETVEIGEKLQVKVGEQIPLDGIMLSEGSSFNTSALTGESKPQSIYKGETAMSGMLNLEKVVEIEATKKFDDSSLAKILQLVQSASTRKAKTELFIRKFAKYYTPAVFFLAVAVIILPYFFTDNYEFKDWFYRAMIFLVISCPCALLISIPLGYFGGIGAASRHGILFKGSNFLDLMAKVDAVVMDKTGTLTKGVFNVQKVHAEGITREEFLDYAAALEKNSNHPIAKAIVEYHPTDTAARDIEEISGHGLKGTVNGKTVLAGNGRLLKKFGINYNPELDEIVESIVILAVDNQYAGYITVADEIKEDAAQAIREMKKVGVTETVMLSGDKDSITQKTASELGLTKAYGGLLPEDKVQKLNEIKDSPDKTVVFVGDGINDAPVLAMSDVGIAMGGMGSDVAIETADVVIQTDQPSKIPVAVNIGRKTKQIVLQNIALAFGVKVLVLILGAGGMATMWEAVFADVGVALLAILNAVRIQNMKF